MRQRSHNRKSIRDWIVAALAIGAFGLAAFVFFQQEHANRYELSLSAGSPFELRSRLAEIMAGEAAQHGLSIRVRGTVGSEESYNEVNAGRLDLALAQGGLGHETHKNVRQVAALNIEPMHLLVKEEIYPAVSRSLEALRGKVVNINKRGSGTHWLALETLGFAGLKPGFEAGRGDYIATTMSQEQLMEQSDRSKLPDATFLVTTMPSETAKILVTKHRYRLVALPFAEAFSLDALSPVDTAEHAPAQGVDVEKFFVYDSVIPAFTYEVDPAVPPEPTHTLGTRLLLVAHKDVPPEAVSRLLEVLFSSRMAHLAKPPLNDSLLQLPPELALHAGTRRYLQRNKPLITGDVVAFLEKATTIGGPLLGGGLFLWQWFRQRYRRKREEGFEHYILRVTKIERRALELETAAMLELGELLRLQHELGHLKTEALARFVSGELKGVELMSGFLAHVNDARNYLARLILHERENLEEEAQLQGRPLKALWNEALSKTKDDAPGSAQPGSDEQSDHQNFQSPVQST